MIVITKFLVPSCKPDQDVYSHQIVYLISSIAGEEGGNTTHSWERVDNHFWPPALRDAKRQRVSSRLLPLSYSPRSFTFSFVFCRWMGILLVAISEGDPKDWKTVGSRFPGVFYHGKKKQLLVKHSIGKKKIIWKSKTSSWLSTNQQVSRFLKKWRMESWCTRLWIKDIFCPWF